MTDPVRQAALQDVFEELIARGDRPDAVTLEDFTRRYPQFATEITDFAVEWVLQDELAADAGSGEAAQDAAGASAVPEAMRRFRERREELAARAESETPAVAADPFADLPPGELRRIAAHLELDKTLLAKLRDRKIVGESIPAELRDALAAQLEVPIPVVVAHLAGPPTIHLAASFKATGKPAAGAKETFAEAVRRSTLAEEEKNRWLDLAPGR